MLGLIINSLWTIIDFLQTYNGAVTAVATVAIGVFTFFLVRVTNRQARLTRDGIELGNREFLATHRPHLIVRNVRSPKIEGGKPIEIEFDVINNGEADAIIVASTFEIHLVTDGGTFQTIPLPIVGKPPGQFMGNPTLIPGQVWREKPCTFTCTWSPAHNRIGTGGEGFFWGGKILYRDALGKQRRLGVFRKFEPSSQRFRAVKDDEYEYDD